MNFPICGICKTLQWTSTNSLVASNFEKNKVLRYAAERLLLIIGEAANHLSPQFRKKHPEIPWAIFIQFRNILAHEYGESLLTRVWLATTESVPELLKALEKLLSDEKNE